MDVIDNLKDTGFKGLFRYPGGCYAPFYRWKIGLLDADAQPPIETPPGYCPAVAGGVNAYTDGMMENGISTDDYLALCEYVGLVPAITIRFQMGQDADVQEARDWVEYVNGDVSTPYGALRAARGHPEPYNVTYWYLGNEIAQQARQPDYPDNSTLIRPPGVAEYKQMLVNVVNPMLAASTSGPLRLLTVSGSVAWNAAWAEAVGEHIYASSFHDGYMHQPRTFTEQAVTTCAMRPRGDFMGAVGALRKTLDKTGRKIAISADEWGLGPPWTVKKFSVAHGMYAAGFLAAVTRGARANNLQFSNYFEPVNEGAIEVLAFSSQLTPVGEVMRLFSHHAGGELLDLPSEATSGVLDTTATLSADGGTLTVTVASLSAVGWATNELTLTLSGWSGGSGTATTLTAQGYTEDSMFDTKTEAVAVTAGKLKVTVPPFSVVQLRLDKSSIESFAAPGPQCALRSGDINGATFAIIMAPARGGNSPAECCDMCYANYGNASGFNGTGCRSWAYSHVHHGCWLKADPAPTKYPHNPTDTSGVVIAPTIVTGPENDTDYVCCAFNATSLVPDFEKRFPGGVKGRVDTAPAGNVSACVDICASLYYYGCHAASWNSGQKQCYMKTAKGNPTHRPGDHSFVLGFKK